MARRAVWWNVTKTVVLLLVSWTVFVVVIPLSISVFEIELGIQRFPGRMILALIALTLFTLLSLWAALTLAIHGDGTPLLIDPPRRLVMTGPYAYVRSPMAIATLGQSAAVGVALGSVPILVFFALCGFVWHFVVRPHEERTLERRFGPTWRRYHQNVRAMRPRLVAYRDSDS